MHQGFASGDLDRDAIPLRMFADQGLEMLVSTSFAKNLGTITLVLNMCQQSWRCQQTVGNSKSLHCLLAPQQSVLPARRGCSAHVAAERHLHAGLYGERVGALTVVVSDPAVLPKVESQLKSTIRPMYSSPPAHGVKVAKAILSDPALFQQWKVGNSIKTSRRMSKDATLHCVNGKHGVPRHCRVDCVLMLVAG